MATDNAIEFGGVFKAFDDQPVLEGLDLTIPWSQVTTILGPSGCGKSVTALSILNLLPFTIFTWECICAFLFFIFGNNLIYILNNSIILCSFSILMELTRCGSVLA